MFANRNSAGRQLASRVGHLNAAGTVVLGLPRGGVVVAAEVARVLHVPLDVVVVRKLPTPQWPELALGALGEDGVSVFNGEICRLARVGSGDLRAIEGATRRALNRRVAEFRGARRPLPLAGRTAIIVDDGLATGATAEAACRVARARGAARIVLAVPVASRDALTRLQSVADEVLWLSVDDDMIAVGQWYDDFTQVTDEEVVALLAQSAERWTDEDVAIPAGLVELPGRLTVPHGATGVVVFAHGSGSSRHSPRNQYVAMLLNRGGLGTLLFDLLTPDEAADRHNLFNIPLLAGRLCAAVEWLRQQPEGKDLPVGLFGASTGAAAALSAAARADAGIAAIVSRGGRPDLAGPALDQVIAPTLLIVGGNDASVLTLNEIAQRHLRCPNRLAVVPGATHLFEEPGTLSAAASLARDWFRQHLPER